jgi:hypothetical protein
MARRRKGRSESCEGTQERRSQGCEESAQRARKVARSHAESRAQSKTWSTESCPPAQKGCSPSETSRAESWETGPQSRAQARA